MTGDTGWQWAYTALIFAATFALAIAGTYLVEHPASRRILAWQPPKREQVAMPTRTSGDGSVSAPAQKKKKIGRNDPCPCGSGKKYKKCCGAA